HSGAPVRVVCRRVGSHGPPVAGAQANAALTDREESPRDVIALVKNPSAAGQGDAREGLSGPWAARPPAPASCRWAAVGCPAGAPRRRPPDRPRTRGCSPAPPPRALRSAP